MQQNPSTSTKKSLLSPDVLEDNQALFSCPQCPHTLSPSALDLPENLREQVRAAGCRQEQQELFAAFGR